MSFLSGLTGSVGRYFNSGSGWTDLLGGVLSGIGGIASGRREDDRAEQNHEWTLALAALKGEEDRATLDFEKQLEDFYEQKNKARQRTALDTYGQFSVQHRRTPGFTNTPPVDVPARPAIERVSNGR